MMTDYRLLTVCDCGAEELHFPERVDKGKNMKYWPCGTWELEYAWICNSCSNRKTVMLAGWGNADARDEYFDRPACTGEATS